MHENSFALFRFGFSAAVNFYATLGYECTGNESTILDCKNVGADCTTDSAEHAVAVICGGQPGERNSQAMK